MSAMSRIHSTAVIDPQAELAPDVTVGPWCVIQGPVRVGPGTELAAQVTLLGHTEIGAGNRFYPGAVIGADPQDLKYAGEPTRLVIGDHNRFREHVTVHCGTVQGGGVTRIGSHNLLMVGCHVAHDAQVGDGTVLSNHVLLAGHVRVKDRAIMNGASACHHFTTVGRLAYVGGLSRITQDVHPFTIVEGHPARVRACNTVGMARAGIPPEDVRRVRDAIFSILVSRRRSTQEAMEQAEREYAGHPLVAELLDSIRAALAGRQGRAAEPRRDGA